MHQERYELVDVIGSGGMATVWRARDTSLGRIVALKRPHPAPADSTVLRRFAREARAAATVSHPNVVAVYDVGEDDAGPYLVMEYIDGPSLATAAVASADTAPIGAEVAAALAALHAAGIVHGDVKPGNILLADGRVELTDFGIALTGDDTSAITREGTVFATPEYAAPETLAGTARSSAADVYALGAVLHELATGTRWNPTEPATQAMPPPALAPILAATLDRDPARRPTADELREQLLAVDDPAAPVAASASVASTVALDGGTLAPATAAATPRPARTATLIFAAALAGVALVAGLAWAVSGDDADGGALAATDLTIPAGSALAPVASTLPSVESTPAPPTSPAEAAPPPPTEPAGPATTLPTPTTTTPATAIANELIALIATEVDRGLEREEAVKIVERIDEAIRAAATGDDRDAESALRDAAKRIERRVDDDAADEAFDALIALADELGVDTERIDREAGRDDEDDD